MSFDPKRHVIKVQGNREYLPVSARLVWFRDEHPDWGIVTTAVEINLTPENNKPPYAIFQAQIFNADGKLMATGTKMEDARGFGDFLEKAETGSVGRALALCGYGTQFAPELEEGHRGDYGGGGGGGGNRYGSGGGGGGGYASRPNGPANNYNGGGNGMGNNRPPMPQERPIAQERPTPERAAPPSRPAPVAPHNDFEDDLEAEPVRAASPAPAAAAASAAANIPGVGVGAGNIAAPKRPAPQGQAPSGGSGGITRVREPEREDPPMDDEDDEVDPFADEEEDAAPRPAATAPARPATARNAAPTNAGNGSEPAPSNRCSADGCNNVLSPPQLSLSMSKFGRPLCLAHQKDVVPAGAAAGGGRGRGGRNAAGGGSESLL